MDEELRILQRTYQSNRDLTAGALLVAAAIRTSSLYQQIIQYLIDASPYRNWDEHEVIYISWNVETNIVRIIVAAYKFYTYKELDDNRPAPRLPEHMSHSERNMYDDAWDSYLGQDLGEITLYSFRYPFDPNSLIWGEPTITSLGTRFIHNNLPSLPAGYFTNLIYGTPPEPPDPSIVVELENTINAERDLGGKIEELSDKPEIVTEFGNRCEDFPACGHEGGSCPRYWDSGELAEMVCVCGASLPPNSRFSICDSCLRQPMEGDSPYDYDYPDYPLPDEYEEYDEDEDY